MKGCCDAESHEFQTNNCHTVRCRQFLQHQHGTGLTPIATPCLQRTELVGQLFLVRVDNSASSSPNCRIPPLLSRKHQTMAPVYKELSRRRTMRSSTSHTFVF